MTALTASERLATMIWRLIKKPSEIYTKSQIQQALAADGIRRTQNVLFAIDVRRQLESKAAAKGLALVIERGCVFVTTEEYQILHKTVTMLRYIATLGESIGHNGRGIDILLRAHDPVSQNMGRQAVAAGVFGTGLRHELEVANATLATTFEAGRTAANASFDARRAKALARMP